MRWLKEYWFSLLMSTFLLLAALYFILLFISPRYDLQRRGFIPCTERLAEAVADCRENKIACTMGAIWDNNLCDLGVIYNGLRDWVGGKQKYPWSNYLFEPELLSDRRDSDNPEVEEFYRQNPNLAEEMAKLKKLNEEQDKDEYNKE